MNGLEPFRLDASARGLIGHLFPFHLVLDVRCDQKVVNAGAALTRWLGCELVGTNASDHFQITRPTGVEWVKEQILLHQHDVVFLTSVADGKQLRGQFTPLANDQLLYVGSPVVGALDSFADLGLSFSDFSPHDATADIVVLTQFSSMQVRDMERKNKELGDAIAARDIFSQRALTDPLSGLVNRRGFWEGWAELSGRDSAAPLLVYLDMDNFKAINDDYGHLVGDDVLRALSSRLAAMVRGDDLAARLGGDEFAVVLTEVEHEKAPARVEELIERLAQPVDTADGRIEISLSAGIAWAQKDRALDQLLRDADTAMYQGRARGTGRITWFDDEMGVDRERRRLLTNDLRVALSLGQLDVAYQPIVLMDSGEVSAFEALARWKHPYLGAIGPDTFVELAERADLIADLDFAVLAQAMTKLAEWRREKPRLQMHANLSGLSISEDLPSRISTLLDYLAIPPDALVLEITESRSITRNQLALVGELAAAGFGLHLDDFGTGFSSMSHLQALPLDGLKVDRSFIARIRESEKDRQLVSATISMARSLELDVVAEGVEDAETESILVDLGCRLAQGYFYSRPVEELAVPQLFTEGISQRSLDQSSS